MKKKKPIKNLIFRPGKPPMQYKREGENVYLCKARKMFVCVSEEERVRQAFIVFLRDEGKSFRLPIIHSSFEISEDLKLRYSSFGNAAGGGYTSYYRSFIIKDKNGENQIISISITGTLSRKNDPKFGNRRGNTQLNVAIDDYEKKHHSFL